MDYDFTNKTTLGKVKVVMLKGERGKTGHGAFSVATAGEMTDKQQIYVYVGSETGYVFGDWYYWNGAAWADGGAYNSETVLTDRSLSVDGEAADAKATGQAVKGADLAVDGLEWESGTIGLSGENRGAPISSSTNSRIRTTTYHKINGLSRITIQPGYKALVCIYTSTNYTSFQGIYDGTEIQDSPAWLRCPSDSETVLNVWIGQDIDRAYLYKIVLADIDDTPNLPTTAAENLSVFSYTDTSLTQRGKAADAKVTGNRFAKLPKFYDMTGVSGIRVNEMPAASYTYAQTSKFTNLPDEIPSDAQLYVERASVNEAGNVALYTVRNRNDASFYYVAFAKDTDTTLNWRKYMDSADSYVQTYNIINTPGAQVKNLNVNSNTGAISASSLTRSVIIPCKPNTNYAIMSAIQGARFIAGYCSTVPADGGTAQSAASATSAYGGLYIPIITTDASAQYLIVYYYHQNYDTYTEDELFNAIMVTEGADYKAFKPPIEPKREIDVPSNGVFGIKFLRNNQNPVVVRTHDSKAILYRQQTGTTVEKSDFDNVFPWCDIRECNVTINNGAKTITYKGASGFSRSNNTFIEIPAFYFKRNVVNENGVTVEEWAISGSPFPGAQIEPWFLEQDGSIAPYRYIAKYEGTIENNKLSVTGAIPTSRNFDLGGKTMFNYYRDYCEDHGAKLASIKAHLAIAHLAAIEMGVLNAQLINQGISHYPFSMASVQGNWNVAQNTATGNVVQLPVVTSGSPSYMKYVRAGDTVYVSSNAQDKSNPRIVESIELVHDGGTDLWEIQFDGDAYAVVSGTTRCYPAMQPTGRTDGMSYVSGRAEPDLYCRAFQYRGIENLYGNIWEVASGAEWAPDVTDPNETSVAPITIDGVATSFTAPRGLESGSDDKTQGFIRTFGYDRAMPWATLPSSVVGSASESNARKFISDEWATPGHNGDVTDPWIVGACYLIVSGGWDHQGENGLFNARAYRTTWPGNWLYGFRAMID